LEIIFLDYFSSIKILLLQT